MLKIAVGQAEGSDPTIVAAQVIARCRAQLGGATPAIGILYRSGTIAVEPLLAAIQAAFPGLCCVGGGTGGDVSSALGFSEDSIVLTLLAGDRVRITAGLGRGAAGDPEGAVAEALAMARAELGGDEALILAWMDGRTPGLGVRVVEALNHQRAAGVAIFGGALTPSDDAPTLQIFGAAAVEDAVTLVLLQGPIAHAFAVNNAWRPIGPRQRVRSSGTVVSHIGARTALDFHRHYLGEHLDPAVEFPLAVFDAGSDRYYLRVPNDYHRERGEVVYGADVPDGAEVQLTEYVRPEVVASTGASVAAALEALAELGDVALAGALVFSCSVRKQVLGTRIAVEGELVRDHLGPLPFAGFYAYGEVAPLCPGGPAFFHNSTMVTLALGERGGDRAAITDADDEPQAAPEPEASALLHKLARSESYRARLEESRELQTAMLRTIGAEIEAARQQIARQNDALRALNAALAREQEKSEALLLNILPREVADELRARGRVEPVFYRAASVLFTDFEGFTRIAARMSPAALLAELDFYFSGFDAIIDRFGLEKLKTIGDAYMCAGGIPAVNETHAVDAVAAAWAMQAWMGEVAREREARGAPIWRLRIGVHTGPLMAGVIGDKKFAYDIWGDTVNLASRLESTGEPGRVNISAATHERVRERFHCERRGRIKAKNAGEIDMYFVSGLRDDPQ